MKQFVKVFFTLSIIVAAINLYYGDTVRGIFFILVFIAFVNCLNYFDSKK